MMGEGDDGESIARRLGRCLIKPHRHEDRLSLGCTLERMLPAEQYASRAGRSFSACPYRALLNEQNPGEDLWRLERDHELRSSPTTGWQREFGASKPR
jgi:hypothetical protein